jgi:hypothetical protein
MVGPPGILVEAHEVLPDRLLMNKKRQRTARRRNSAQNNAASDRRWVEGKNVHLGDEIRHVQRLAAERISRIVTIGPLLLFSTDSGDAWMLDPADRLATRVAEAGEPRPARIEETKKMFTVSWQGHYEIMESAFVFSDDESGRVTTILGYPTRQITERITDVFG